MYQHEAETGFENVIWTDECTVQLETHDDSAAERRENAHAINHSNHSTYYGIALLVLIFPVYL